DAPALVVLGSSFHQRGTTNENSLQGTQITCILRTPEVGVLIITLKSLDLSSVTSMSLIEREREGDKYASNGFVPIADQLLTKNILCFYIYSQAGKSAHPFHLLHALLR